MNIQPLQDQILVRRDAEEDVSAGGIIITPGQKKQLPRGRGVVLAVGPGLKRTQTIDAGLRNLVLAMLDQQERNWGSYFSGLRAELENPPPDDTYHPMDVKVGDRVFFSKLSGDKVRDDLAVSDVDDDLLLIRESEVIAIVEEGGA